MDYDYYDDSRTRFQLQSGPSNSPEEEKKAVRLLEVCFCFCVALFLVGVAWFSPVFLQFILLWIAASLFVGPFAPLSATGGSCSVGVGEILPAEEEEPEVVETEMASVRNSKRGRKPPNLIPEEHPHVKATGFEKGKGDRATPESNGKASSGDEEEDVNDSDGGEEHVENDDDMYDYDGPVHQKAGMNDGSDMQSGEGPVVAGATIEAEWTAADIDLLRKLMLKYPKGMLKRWEVIAESFDGLHSVESVVKMSKSLGEKKKGGSNDAYSDFLAKRKGSAKSIASPLTQRWDMTESLSSKNDALKDDDDADGKMAMAMPAHGEEEEKKKKKEWTEAEDKALLNALKTFPKDTPMRWEKVAMAVPSRSKQQCFRRYAQLKEGFRTNKLEKA